MANGAFQYRFGLEITGFQMCSKIECIYNRNYVQLSLSEKPIPSGAYPGILVNIGPVKR